MAGRSEHYGGSVSEEAETTLPPLDSRLLGAQAGLLPLFKCEYQVKTSLTPGRAAGTVSKPLMATILPMSGTRLMLQTAISALQTSQKS
jgi:hypothetical protein